jgi:hypothetical protein
MTTIALDPGMRDLGWCVFDDDRIIAQGSVRNEETHIAVPERVLHVIAGVAVAVKQYGCTRMVVEGFGDQGAKRNAYLHRWETPMVIGGLIASCDGWGIESAHYAAPEDISGYREYHSMWDRKISIYPGDECLFAASEHARDAACHGIADALARGRIG